VPCNYKLRNVCSASPLLYTRCHLPPSWSARSRAATTSIASVKARFWRPSKKAEARFRGRTFRSARGCVSLRLSHRRCFARTDACSLTVRMGLLIFLLPYNSRDLGGGAIEWSWKKLPSKERTLAQITLLPLLQSHHRINHKEHRKWFAERSGRGFA